MRTSQALLRALTPYTVGDLPLERWGPNAEGGYVVPSGLLSKATVLVTGGVSDDARFEAEVAANVSGIRIVLLDHTIDKPPDQTPLNAIWHKLGLGSAPGCISLEAATAMSGAKPDDTLVMKIDIESAEWELLESTPEEFWDRVAVLLLEMHGLDRKVEWGRYTTLLEKLNRHMLIVHLHGNNYARTALIEGMQVPMSIEATYINRKLIPAGQPPVAWNHGAPGSLDRRNNPEVIDIPFDFWMMKSPLIRIVTRIGLYVLPWRLRKNFCLNLTPKSMKRRNRIRAGTEEIIT